MLVKGPSALCLPAPQICHSLDYSFHVISDIHKSIFFSLAFNAGILNLGHNVNYNEFVKQLFLEQYVLHYIARNAHNSMHTYA